MLEHSHQWVCNKFYNYYLKMTHISECRIVYLYKFAIKTMEIYADTINFALIFLFFFYISQQWRKRVEGGCYILKARICVKTQEFV